VQIVVNHITRMHDGHVCVAGLHRDGHHIRPVLEHGRLWKELTSDYGGPFCMGAVVELGQTRPRPAAPEVEDHVFDPAVTHFVRMADPEKLWTFLDDRSASSLQSVFGETLTPDGITASMPVGTGVASLGVLRPQGRPRIERWKEKVRIVVTDEDLGPLSLPLTDLRVYDLESNAVDDRRLELLKDRVRRGRDVLLSVGVGRPWAREGGELRHWLQVNNVHLDDNPLWPLPSAG
jgi:hypothetical protein